MIATATATPSSCCSLSCMHWALACSLADVLTWHMAAATLAAAS